MPEAIEQRVAQIKHDLERLRLSVNPIHRFTLKAVPESVLAKVSATDGFPRDLLLVLQEIGEMSNWGSGWASRPNDMCANIDWWVPCRMHVAVAEEQCSYDVRESNFTNGQDLLVFAWDCRARVYFYDTSENPWRLVSTDGLSFSFLNEEADGGGAQENACGYQCDAESRDAVEIIKEWVESKIEMLSN